MPAAIQAHRVRKHAAHQLSATTRVGDWRNLPHLDLHVADAAGQAAEEAPRLVSLGAERVDWDSYSDDPDFVVLLADPNGNRLCVVDLSHEHG